jgi:hypothetical protein
MNQAADQQLTLVRLAATSYFSAIVIAAGRCAY